MNDFKRFVVDNWVYKIALAVIAVLALATIIFNLGDFIFAIYLYVPMGMLYAGMYKRNQLKQGAGNTKIMIFHTILYVISYPAALLYKLAILTLQFVIGIAKWSTPKFGGKRKWW